MTTRTLSTGRAATSERWQEAARRALREGIEVRQLNSTGQWVANSGTQPGVSYELEIIEGIVLSCSCEAAQFGDPVCKHKARFYLEVGMIALPEMAAEPELIPA